jgi:CHAT domain-containing protein/Tfp pilus assembly protein PilF
MNPEGRIKHNHCIFLTILFVSLMLTACMTPSILVTREQNRGDNSFNGHQYNEAIAHYTQMLTSSKKLGIYRNFAMEAEVYRKIANCYTMIGRYEEALDNINQATLLDSLNQNLLGRMEDYRDEGQIYVYMGSFYSGMTSLEKSLAMSEKLEQSIKNVNRLSSADTYLALSQIYAAMGRSADALPLSEKALSIFRSANDARGEMESLLNIGTIYSYQGDINPARQFTENSLKIARENKMGMARHYQLLASVSSSMGEYENALRYQEKALDEANRYGIAAQVIWSTIGMGDIYRELGDIDHAEKYFNAAKEGKDTLSMTSGSLEASLELRLGDFSGANKYFSSEGSLNGLAISALRMAELMIGKEERDSAVMLLNQAGNAFRLTDNIQGLSNVQILLAKVYIDAGNPLRAGTLLDSALKATEFPETIWQAWFQKGRMYEVLKRTDNAIQSYRNAISVIERIRGNLTIDEFKSTFFDSKREVYDRLIHMLLRENNLVDAFQVSEQARARAFYDILANKKIDFRGSVPGDLISKEQEKRLEMQQLYKLLQRGEKEATDTAGSGGDEIKRIRESLAGVQAEYEDILRMLKLNNPAYADMVSAKPVLLPDLQSHLDTRTAVMAYWISDNELVYWLITHSGIAGGTVKINNNDLSGIIKDTRSAIRSNEPENTTAGLSRLYRLLFEPVENQMENISNLVVIPNGALHFLPFQALIDNQGEYLVQKYNIVYSPSAGIYIICNDRLVRRGMRFMGMALSDVTVDNKTGLPGTDDELRKILPLFPDNISSFGMQSTETFAKKNAGDYNFIHFATHGSYNYKQPLYSYLLFPPSQEDDGRLNVYEVLEMNLNAKLVTLSACETGLGNLTRGDEITGLSRAFLFAGSSSVLVSLWSVADYSTSMLMTKFYGYLKDHTLQEALTLAQRDVIKVYPQPLYWSPFILIGNGNISGN